MDNQIETDIGLAQKLFEQRMRVKRLSQISFECREIDRAFPSDYYDFNSAEKMSSLYKLIEDKIVELAEEIKESRK